MLLNEIITKDYEIRRLLVRLDFVTDGNEINEITKKLVNKGIEPDAAHIKDYLMKCLGVPIDDLPMPERAIILRSKGPERVL
jgi:hypothetical protein